MSKSYTPGLKILENTKVSKERILPLKGEVHVKENNQVDSKDIVASTEIPGNVQMVNVANQLNIDSKDVPGCMIVRLDKSVKQGQVIGRSKGLFGLFKSEVKSPIDGKLINISEVTGQAIISEKPLSIQIDAYIPGTITKVIEKEGVVINSIGMFVQGILGISGESQGVMKVIAQSPSDQIKTTDLNE